MNLCIFEGTIINDLNITSIKSKNGENIESLNLQLAIYRQGKGENKIYDYVTINAYGNDAKFINNYYKKQDNILVRTKVKTTKNEEGKWYSNYILIEVFPTEKLIKNEINEEDIENISNEENA